MIVKVDAAGKLEFRRVLGNAGEKGEVMVAEDTKAANRMMGGPLSALENLRIR